MSKIGDQAAFPVSNGEDVYSGMTYRQWLIGECGSSLIGYMVRHDQDKYTNNEISTLVIDVADAIIDKLDAER